MAVLLFEGHERTKDRVSDSWDWPARLPSEARSTRCSRAASGEGAQARALRLRRSRTASSSAASARTAAELWQAADVRKAAVERGKAAARAAATSYSPGRKQPGGKPRS